jgi:tripartite ATP-independent transporter DctP family solute receptor
MDLTRKQFLRSLGSVALGGAVVGTFGMPGKAVAKGSRFKIADFYAADHSMNRALRQVFVPKVEAYTEGRIAVSVHDNSSLGSEKELTEGVRLGTIEMGVTGGLLSASLPKLALLELPYVFTDYAHAWRMLDGSIGRELAAEFEKAGIVILAWVGNGFRAISNGVRPINTLADTSGIRMRMPENKVYIETGKALGFSVVTMPFGEVFTALSQKVVDGQDNPPPTVLASKFYEVQEHLAISNHIFSYGAISINKSLWMGLGDADKQGLRKAAQEAAVVQREMLESDAKANVAKLAELGMKVTHPDIVAFQKATEPVRRLFAERVDGGKELLARIAAA